MDKLAKGIRCSEGESIKKLERLSRTISSNSGDQVIKLEKVKVFCDGAQWDEMDLFFQNKISQLGIDRFGRFFLIPVIRST